MLTWQWIKICQSSIGHVCVLRFKTNSKVGEVGFCKGSMHQVRPHTNMLVASACLQRIRSPKLTRLFGYLVNFL